MFVALVCESRNLGLSSDSTDFDIQKRPILSGPPFSHLKRRNSTSCTLSFHFTYSNPWFSGKMMKNTNFLLGIFSLAILKFRARGNPRDYLVQFPHSTD